MEFIHFQFQLSNESQVTLRNVDFEATGAYYCEVSTDTPIFTKESNEEPLHIIRTYINQFISFIAII